MNRRAKVGRDASYVALCYHYLRPEKRLDPFPRILGNRIDEFRKQIKMLETNYEIISPDEAKQFFYSDFLLAEGKIGALITFDDGLADHYVAAHLLAG